MGTSAGSLVAVVAEKPSVARDVARVLKATRQGQGWIEGNGWIVTWAVGHLVALAQPHEIRPEWRAWRRDLLPMIPEAWPLVVYEQTKDQFEVVRKILNSAQVGRVVCATDAGREGELIFRYIYEASECRKPVSRLWISSLTPEAIRTGFEKLRPAAEFDGLADAARGRSRADWLVGMNLSRAYTLASHEELSVGRVQTPTLAMVVERELAIRAFVPEDYLNVVATFSPRQPESYQGTWFRAGVEPLDAAMRLAADGVEAEAILARARAGQAAIESVKLETRRMPPPLLYDLTELQRHANRLYGFSAQKTLDLAQALYERHKLVSYPRTDSRHLSRDVARTLPRIVGAIAGGYQALLAPGTGERPLGRRFLDDEKVTDHHAIIPTGVPPEQASLDPDERKIFDLVARRLLAAWHDDYVWSVTTVITAIGQDRYHSTGSMVIEPGWKVLDIATRKKAEEEEAEQALPPGLAQGQPQTVLDIEAQSKKTRSPKRLTEATLLTAMETAGRTLDDKELSEAMKETGLGTPATRAQIIEVLLKRGFIERRGKSLEATGKGIRLIEVVHPEVKSPAMTGAWEAQLKKIERSQARLEPFVRGIEDYVREVVGKAAVGRPPAPVAPAPPPSAPAPAPAPASSDLERILHERFGFASFRPNQEAVCRALVAGHDVLLVMPTGSGKSLCYQLPGLALGGTTLIVSPLIALMEDQVAQLAGRGLAADRIHSNRDRGASRETSVNYLEGKLDYLFVAPERLRVAGFPEMLAKHPPRLVAIDEAHCISQWGHDFRPDYRMIGQYLPGLRPAPVIALTATATPLVQDDIVEQLGLDAPRRFIHGFRRDNIAIEVVEAPPGGRSKLALEVLSDSARRPAIVYTPTRREAAALARAFERHVPAAAYHAGLDAARRKEVQTAFLEGRLEVTVATIAFGMGIDKPDIRTVIHTALPGSIEAYYQEIGRAGRDGAPSRAILMHSYADRYTHDYFFERDYPEEAVLASLFERLTEDPQPKDALRASSRLAAEIFDIALEKLWIHGGALVDFAENVSRGSGDWRPLYLAQREHKAAQFEQMLRYSDANQCRMLALVRYFGDAEDSGRRCGICDFCAAADSVAQSYREPSALEREQSGHILAALQKVDSMATGRLHTQVFADGSLSRRAFEKMLGALARAGLVEVTEASFEKEGQRIAFRKAKITVAGRAPEAASSVRFAADIEAEHRPKKRKKKPKPEPPKPEKAKPEKPKKPAPAVLFETAPPPSERRAAVLQALKAWRLSEAKRWGIPAFRILHDRALEAIAAKEPRTARELVEIPGVGLRTAEKYGAQIFRVLERSG